ncbi:hypothetical protein [Nocardioides sp. GXQ0305]|jgi:hypothetical protein
MSEQPIAITEAEAEAHAAEFLASQNLSGTVELLAEGDAATVVVSE